MDKLRLLHYLKNGEYSELPEILLKLRRYENVEGEISTILIDRLKEEKDTLSIIEIFNDLSIKTNYYRMVEDTSKKDPVDPVKLSDANLKLDTVLFRWTPITEYWFSIVKSLIPIFYEKLPDLSNPEIPDTLKKWIYSWSCYLSYIPIFNRDYLPKPLKETLSEQFLNLAVIRFLYGYSPELWGSNFEEKRSSYLNETLEDSDSTLKLSTDYLPFTVECHSTYLQETKDKGRFNIPWEDPPEFLRQIAGTWKDIAEYTYRKKYYYHGIFDYLKALVSQIDADILREPDNLPSGSRYMCKLPINMEPAYFPDIKIGNQGNTLNFTVDERIGIGYYNPRGIASLNISRASRLISD